MHIPRDAVQSSQQAVDPSENEIHDHRLVRICHLRTAHVALLGWAMLVRTTCNSMGFVLLLSSNIYINN